MELSRIYWFYRRSLFFLPVSLLSSSLALAFLRLPTLAPAAKRHFVTATLSFFHLFSG